MAPVGRHVKYLPAPGEEQKLVDALVAHADELRARGGCELALVGRVDDGVWLTEVWESAERRDSAPAPAGIGLVSSGTEGAVEFEAVGTVIDADHGSTDFDSEEWRTIVDAPVLVAASIIAADGGGNVREALSLGRAYAEARASNPAGEILKRVLTSPPSVDPGILRGHPEETRTRGFERLRTAIAAIERKGEPADLADYRGFVSWLAETVARAHREGGFLGIGGKEISDAEQQVLDELSTLLR